jgi:predicted dehydrogenase
MTQKLTAVLVGCGGISRAWLRALPDIEGLALVGLVDIVEAAAQQRAEEFEDVILRTTEGSKALIDTDLDAMLTRVQPDIVFNCTIPEAHVDVTLTALAHGCHVLGEKPLADSMANARTMVEAAAQADRLFAVIQNRRFNPAIRRLVRFLRADTIGALTTLNSDFYIGAHFGGFRDHMEHVLLLDMAIHTFDAARLIAGADPVSVYCREWNPPGSWYDHDASAVAIFELDNGADTNPPIVYTYRGSWCAEGLNTSWESDWRVIGQQGSVTWDGTDDGFRAEVVTGTGDFRSELAEVEVPPRHPDDKVGGHAGQIADFVACVREGRTPETVGEDNIKSLAMVFGAIESAAQQRPITIEI